MLDALVIDSHIVMYFQLYFSKIVVCLPLSFHHIVG